MGGGRVPERTGGRGAGIEVSRTEPVLLSPMSKIDSLRIETQEVYVKSQALPHGWMG